MANTRDTLLDAAERGMRLRGYHAVSFRDLADELGIKSASVHYYFRQKEDLGAALVARYQDRFFAALEDDTGQLSSSTERVSAFTKAYRNALVGSDTICLCGMLGAESAGLPEPVAQAVSGFFEKNIDWLVAALPDDLALSDRRKKARHIVATLQGAMMLASALDNTGLFDSAVADLMSAQQN